MQTPTKPNPIVIRPARHGDLDTLVALLQTLFALEQDFTPQPQRQRIGLQRFLDGCGKHRCMLVAEIDGQVVGMATLQVLISTAEGGPVGLVEDVVIQESFRSVGVGRQLMCALDAWAATRGLTRLQLLADGDNQPALAFYRRIGWAPTQLICLRKSDLGG